MRQHVWSCHTLSSLFAVLLTGVSSFLPRWNAARYQPCHGLAPPVTACTFASRLVTRLLGACAHWWPVQGVLSPRANWGELKTANCPEVWMCVWMVACSTSMCPAINWRPVPDVAHLSFCGNPLLLPWQSCHVLHSICALKPRYKQFLVALHQEAWWCGPVQGVPWFSPQK